MKDQLGTIPFFPFDIPITSQQWHALELGAISRLIAERGIPKIIFFRQLSMKLNRERLENGKAVHAGQLNLFATLMSWPKNRNRACCLKPCNAAI